MTRAKEPYETPEIVKVRLARDEMATTGCKGTTVGGRDFPCTGSRGAGACRETGS